MLPFLSADSTKQTCTHRIGWLQHPKMDSLVLQAPTVSNRRFAAKSYCPIDYIDSFILSDSCHKPGAAKCCLLQWQVTQASTPPAGTHRSRMATPELDTRDSTAFSPPGSLLTIGVKVFRSVCSLNAVTMILFTGVGLFAALCLISRCLAPSRC